MSSNINAAYLSLIKLGIGHKADVLNVIDWNAVRLLASIQGLAAVVLDGVKALMDMSADSGSEDGRRASSALEGLGLDFKFDWMGESVVMYEQRYEQYKKVIGRLAEFYNSHGFKMMILKGYGLSLNYPVPNHRPCGDIDIWQFGRYKEADAALSKEKGIKIDNSHHHHTVFYVDGFMVENHYDIINVHVYKANAELEKSFKALAMDDSNFVEVGGEKVYLPSANLHALFQLKHCISHFASTEINIRHVLDWAFFVEKHGSEIDWKWLVGVLDRFKMVEFFNCLNAICGDDLGFDAGLFAPANEALNEIAPSESSRMVVDRELKERVLLDMITPEFSEEEPKGNVFKRVSFKYRRWQANAWKQRLCYSDNRFVSFWKSVWAHILKPSSI
jgi:hypothetical protein